MCLVHKSEVLDAILNVLSPLRIILSHKPKNLAQMFTTLCMEKPTFSDLLCSLVFDLEYSIENKPSLSL